MQGNNSSLHPYFPSSLHIPEYIENDLGILEILGYFFGGIACSAIPISHICLKGYNASRWRKAAIFWFIMCGFIHTVLEGYFGVYNNRIAERMDFLSQVWKEYAKGDSRYMVRDPFIVCMESFTGWVEGPMCFLAAYAHIYRRSYRFPIQITVSLLQCYGCILYFSIEIFDGLNHGPLWHPLYFWFYFFFMNILWIVIPLCLIVDAMVNMSASQASFDKLMATTDTKSKKKRLTQ